MTMPVHAAAMVPFADMGEPCISNAPTSSTKQDHRPQAVADTIIVAPPLAKRTRTMPARTCRAERGGLANTRHRPAKVAARRTGGQQNTDPEMDEIRKHRRSQEDPTLIEVFFAWKRREPSWVSEGTVQWLDQDALFRYWSTVDGGRFSILDGSDLWHVLRIEDHRIDHNTGKVELRITWIGSDKQTWEPEDAVEVHAEEHVKDYWGGIGGRDCCVAATKGARKKRSASAAGTTPRAERRRK